MLDGAIYRRWLTNIGRLPAHARIAHLLCELFTRLQATGRADHGSFKLPVTQTDIGDAMGLSTVHVNRTFQQLRAEGFITLHLTSLSCASLRAAAEFDPSVWPPQYSGTFTQSADARVSQSRAPVGLLIRESSCLGTAAFHAAGL
jgi:hypothetical protein